MSNKAFYALLNALVKDIEKASESLSEHLAKKGSVLSGSDEDEKIFYSAGFSAIVSGIYTKTEDVLNKIMKEVDGETLSSSSWHSDLLKLMSVETEYRPAFLEDDSYTLLLDICGFRHVQRHAYAQEMRPEEVLKKCTQCIEAVSLFRRDFDQFSESFFDVPRPVGNSHKPS